MTANKLHEVGCRKCSRGGMWKIFSDGQFFIARCECGHEVPLGTGVLRDKPDPLAINMRYFT